MEGRLGNPKKRIIFTAIIITLFNAFTIAYNKTSQQLYRDSYEDEADAWSLILAGSIISLIAAFWSACTMYDKQKYEYCSKIFKCCAVLLIIGSIIYLIGWLWFISIVVNAYLSRGYFLGASSVMVWFAEAFLPTAMSILLAIDMFKEIMNSKRRRSKINCVLMFTVSLICGLGYFGGPLRGYPLTNGIIAIGYILISLATFLFLIYNVCCFSYATNCRKTITVIMTIATIITAVGYWMFANEINSYPSSMVDFTSSMVVFYIGISFLVIGINVILLLDMWPHIESDNIVLAGSVDLQVKQYPSAPPIYEEANKIANENTAVNEKGEDKFDINQFFNEQVQLDEFNVEYVQMFKRHGFDKMSTIKHITDQELTDMGIDMKGHRLAILSAIQQLDNNDENDGKVTNY